MTTTSKPRPLAVGDRVAVYWSGGRYTGTVTSTPFMPYILIEKDNEEGILRCHPKQCRRLKPKQPRRRVWLVVPSYGSEWSRAYYDEALARQMPDVLGDSSATIQEFIEVRRKESK